jgi:ribosome-associated translation inhibitor RaiA
MAVRQTAPVWPETHGPVPAGLSELVTARVASLLRIVDRHVDAVRIVLTVTANPAVQLPATARVTVILDGRVVLVQAADATLYAAVERMIARLRMRLGRVATGHRALREADQSL